MLVIIKGTCLVCWSQKGCVLVIQSQVQNVTPRTLICLA